MRKILAGVVAALVFGVGLVVVAPVATARAESVPPSVLQACSDPGADSGGWEARDFISRGTSSGDPAEVRPRTARLGEPCVDDAGGAYESPVLAVPVELSEVPREWVTEGTGGVPDPSTVAGMCSPPGDAAGFTAGDDGAALGGPSCSVIPMVWCPDYDASARECLVPEVYGGVVRVVSVAPHPNGVEVTTAANLGTFSDDPDGAWGNTQIFRYCQNAEGLYEADGSLNGTVGAGQGLSLVDATFVVGGCEEYPDPSALAIMMRTSELSSWVYVDGFDVVPGGAAEGTQPAQFVFGAGPHYTGESYSLVRCAASYSGDVASTYQLPDVLIEDVGVSEPPPVLGEDGMPTAWSLWTHFELGDPLEFTVADCAYLHSIELWVCAFVAHDAGQHTCTETTWSADRWRQHSPYAGPEAGTPEAFLCTLEPDTPGCYDVLNPTPVDGTDFDVVCAGAPELTWGNLLWVSEMIAHYARCLSVPLNGYDRGGWVSSAWTESAGGDLSTLAATVTQMAQMTGTCGVVGETVEIVGVEVAFDSCSWGWAPPLRELAYWAVMIFGSAGVLWFLVETILGITKGRKVPNPFGSGK